MILNRPGFSAVVALVLALGIGATSAIFSVVNAVLLRPLPYPEPDRLMMVSPDSERGGRGGSVNTATGPDYVEWRDQCRSCAQMAAYSGTGPSNLTGGAEPDRAQVAQVTGNLFATLGAQPMLVRTFLPEETGRSLFGGDGGNETAVIRTDAEPRSFIAGLRSDLQAVDKDVPPHNVATMEQVIAKKVADPRFYTLLLGSFSALALALSAAGIYSVISYSVTQRMREIGIRLALGAQSGAILRLVVGQGMALTLAGLAIGLAGAFALTRVLSDFLYQVSVTDPGVFALLSLLLAVVALLACYLPARRASKVDPVVALRHE
jgi:hypothetical protein